MLLKYKVGTYAWGRGRKGSKTLVRLRSASTRPMDFTMLFIY